MKKILLISLLLSFASFFPACNDSSTEPSVSDMSEKYTKIQKLLDSSWNAYSKYYNIPDSCGIAFYIHFKGQTRFFKAALPESTNEKYKWRIASNTKVFTAAAILLLQQQGMLNINDCISDNIPNSNQKYIPETSDFNIPFKNKITIKQLLQHQSGVFDLTNSVVPDSVNQDYRGKNYYSYIIEKYGENHQFTIDEYMKVLAESQIYYFEPGTDYHYSNTGYAILAKIIERVSGTNYSDFITNNFINKLNLKNTSCPWLNTDNQIPPPYINGYFIYYQSVMNYTISNMSANIAEGNIISSFEDLAYWIKVLLKGNAGLNANSIMSMQEYSKSSNYGLGLAYDPVLGFGHNGAHIGYLSYCFYRADMDLSYSLLCNYWDYSDEVLNQTFEKENSFMVSFLKAAISILSK